ncbi:MAG: prepilin-type N-terminal cleavage/methylation domain-containing protein [Terracidiphilus sp.]
MEPSILTGKDGVSGVSAVRVAGGVRRRYGKEDSVIGIRKQDAGFTLIELMIVMMIIGILMLMAVPRFTAAINMAREAVLKEDLHVMRTAIDSYTMDKQKAPQSLDDLITDGYLRSIPEDPFTRTKDSWVTDTSDAMHSLDQTDPGIDDVHSGSQEEGSDGQPYSTW